MQKLARKSETIGYDPVTCTFLVPSSERQRLQGRHRHDDVAAAIKQAGAHTRNYPESFRRRIETDPARFLERDLRWQFFRPKPQPEPADLAELVGQIRLCPTFIYEALTGKIEQALAAEDLLGFYRIFCELGGTGFEPTDDPAASLVRLLEACGQEKRLPGLQEIDVRILKHLYAVEVPKMPTDLMAELCKSRKTISERLSHLRALGLTCRRFGKTSGETLTAKARKLLENLDDPRR